MFSQMPSRLQRASLRPLPFLLAVLLAAIASVSAAAQHHTLSAEKHTQIEKVISAFMTANSVPGVSVAIVQNGQPIWSAGFGLADLDKSSPALLHALPPRLHLQVHHRRRHPTALRTRQARSRRSGAKILPRLPPKRF